MAILPYNGMSMSVHNWFIDPGLILAHQFPGKFSVQVGESLSSVYLPI